MRAGFPDFIKRVARAYRGDVYLDSSKSGRWYAVADFEALARGVVDGQQVYRDVLTV